ncbi:MAG: hypothetical protein ACOCZT_01335 [Halanaerobiales bacterium]
MNKNMEFKKIINYLNYKDILIILFLWYFMAAIILIFKELSFDIKYITSFFHFLFIVSGRFIFFGIVMIYLSSLYPVDFKQLGINFSNTKSQILSNFSKILFLLVILIIIINMPLSYKNEQAINSLFNVTGPDSLISLLIPFFLIFFASFFISISEQFFINVIIFELFNNTLFNFIISLILTALFYSIILLNFIPSRIFINFIVAIISILIYRKDDSIIGSSIFMAGYYASYISFVYGWDFIMF